MMLKRLLLVGCLLIFLFGCAAGSATRINGLSVGMTKDEVIEVMGEPNYTSAARDVEILSYKLKSGAFYTETYSVRLKDGKVDRFGQQGSFGTFY
jgi:hypothetical protein